MQSFIRLTLVLITAASFSLRAQPVRDIGKIEVIAENKTLPIRVSANTPELNASSFRDAWALSAGREWFCFRHQVFRGDAHAGARRYHQNA